MSITTVIGSRYEIVKQLSEGGFGKTYIAKDLHTPSQRLCVIKQLKPMDENPQIYRIVKERFEKEAAMLEELGEGTSQIPKLFAYFEAEGEFYLVQEFIEGETLTNLVEQQGSLSENTVIDILIKLLDILEYIQKKHIIHRDIKPDNIILRASDKMPVLIDFGAVKATMSTTLATGGNSTQSIVIGTPGFMPAEQSVGRPVYASDLYALGLTAIYLLTGKIPEQLESDPLTGEFIWQQFAPNLNPKFSQIVAQCIKSHSRERFLTAIQMKEALQQVKFSPRNIVTLGYIPPHEQEFFPTPPTEISASPTQIMSPVSSSPSISNSMPPVVQQKGLSIGQVITLFVAILGVIAAGGLGYFLYQQQQEFQSKIAELEATQQEKEDAEKEAEAKQQEEEKAQLQAEKERLQQEKQELQTKLTQQQQSSGSSLSTNNNISAALPRLASCGSPAGSGTVWYPVLGNAKALHLVKNNYCADAFITKNGNLQVASFTSTDEAEQFARLLSNATGYNFWVKY